MENERGPAIEKIDHIQKLHTDLGEALANEDTADALRLLETLKEALEEKSAASKEGEDTGSETKSESEETMGVEAIIEKIYDLQGTEFTIFGTARGLTVPLSAVMGEDRELTALSKKETHSYERGSSREKIVTGMRLTKIRKRKKIEVVEHSRDAFGRVGFKGIEIIFPTNDEGVADTVADNVETLHEAVLKIWTGLAEHISSDQRQYFTPE